MENPLPTFDRKPLLAEMGEVLKLSLPIVITLTSQTVMQVVDALMLGHYSASALAAVGPAALTYWTLGACVMGLISCNNTFVSQSLGRGRPHDCARYTVHAFALALLAEVLVIPFVIQAPAIFGLFGHAPDVQLLEVDYFRPVALRIGGMGALVALSTFFQATNRPIVPMIVGIAANVLNLIGDYALIYGHFGLPRWGIFGAGLMTMLATYFEVAVIMLIFLSRANDAVYGTRQWRPFEMKKVTQFLRVGIGAAVTQGLDLASWTIFITMVVGRLGKATLAGNNAAQQIMHLSFMPAIGLSIGVTALVGRHIGEGDVGRAKRVAYYSMAAGAGYMTIMGILFFIFRRQLIGLFMPDGSDGVMEQEVIRAGGIILMYVALFQLADGIGILSAGALKGAGDTIFPAVLQIVLAWCLFLPAVFYLGRADVWGIHGAWIAATAYIWVYDAVLFWRFSGEAWRKINIFA